MTAVNRVVKEQLGGRRLRLTDDQRRRLAAKGSPLGRRLFARVATIVTPDTIRRWHRRLIAAKWAHADRRPGRPGLMKEIRALIVRMAEDGFLRGKRYLILDADSKFTDQFKRIVKDFGVTPVPISHQAPNMNAIAERFVLSIKRECLSRLILFGTHHLERAVREFVDHYHEHRPHQGLGNELIAGLPTTGAGDVVARDRLGGLLRHYERAA
jgi:transposase InsO family protein